jgi:uncharacterized protein DUF4231
MLNVAADATARQKLALDRVQQLIATAEQQAARASRNYFRLQLLIIGLAAITPCWIILAKENPTNPILNWFQLFFPAIAAICAGLSHVFRWREDSVRYTSLAESIRSQLWRFQTRAGEFGGGMTDEQAIEKLVVRVDELNLQSLARWSSSQLSEGDGASSSNSTARAHSGAE